MVAVDAQLTLGGDNGAAIRFATGPGAVALHRRRRVTTEWYPYLFSVGAAGFFDMGGVSGSSLVPATPPPVEPPRKVLRDIGFGLRVGNMRSALGNVVHIDVAHPLDGDPSISRIQVIVGAKRSF